MERIRPVRLASWVVMSVTNYGGIVPGVFKTQNSRLSRQREQEQSLSRPTRIRFSVKVRGAGETRMTGKQGLVFTTYFLEAPTFTSGGMTGTAFLEGSLPLATAWCLGFQQNDLGLYVGADMGYVVDASDPRSVVFFHLTFEGIALRTTAAIDNVK